MAAPYSPDGSDPMDTQSFVHSRNLSTLSNTPLLTNRTFDSHPTEPLLRLPLVLTPGNEDVSPTDLPRTPLRPTATPLAKKSLFRHVLYAFKKRSKIITLSLELIMGIWATYNTVRYFLAFLQYRNTAGQGFSLSLAVTAGISAVLAIWAMALSTYILRFQDGNKSHSMLLWLRLLSAFFFLTPAIINIALVFVWKSSPNSELDLRARCHLDVDVVWSIVPNKCSNDAPPWSIWVALSFIRFLLTASLITIYLAASLLAFISPIKSSHRHSRWSHSDVGSNEPSFARITSLTDHHPSDLTLDVSLNGDSSPQSGLSRLARSRSFDPSPDYIFYGRMIPRSGEADREMSGFVDRFRSLISQITREMEGTLEAGSDSPSFDESNGDYTSIPKPYHPEFNDIIDANDDNYDFSRNDKNNMFNLPPLPMTLGYNEFGVPYPPDENIRVLGGVVRRMPTIESMGSDEMTRRSSATSNRPDGSIGHRAASRPPTRNTLLTVSTTGHDGAGSEPPSRANSLSGRAERLLSISPISATSEHGELLGRISRRLSTPSSGDFTFRTATDDTMSSSESRGTVATYHTASMGDSHSPT